MSENRTTTPPHAPVRGRSAKHLGRFHVTGVFWYRLWLFGARKVPNVGFMLLAPIFTTVFFFCLIRIRRAVGGNLEAVLGPAGWFRRQIRVYKTLYSFAWCITERYQRLAGKTGFQFEIENVEHWQRATADGAGAVLITGHVGNWEVGAALPSGQRRQVHLVRESELDPQAQEFTENLLRESLGDTYTTHFADLDVRLGMELRDALGRGELVALQGDRPRRTGKRIGASLFGRPYELPSGPIVLARTAGVPIVPVFVLRVGQRKYRLVFRPPIFVDPGADRNAALQSAASAIVESMEWAIRETPHQWFCFRQLWNDSDGS